MTKTLIGTATTDSNGKATIDYIPQGLGDIKIIATCDNLDSNELIIHDYLYAPSFTTDNPTHTTRLDSGYQVSQSNGELTLIGGCISDGWSNEGLWECNYDVKWNGTRYQWFRTLMALPNTLLLGGWEGCLATPQSGLGSNAKRQHRLSDSCASKHLEQSVNSLDTYQY